MAPGGGTSRHTGLKFLLLAAGLALVLFLGWKLGAVGYLQQHKEDIRSFIRGLGPWGPSLYALIYAGGVVLAIPGTVLTVIAALLFGTWGGTAVVVAGATAGASAAFLIGRYLGRDFIAGRLRGRWKAIDEGVREGGFSYLLFLRLVPLVPFNVLNYGSGLTGVRFRDYVLATAIGIVPGTFVYCYATTSLANVQQAKSPIFVAFGLLGLLALTPVAFRTWRKGSSRSQVAPQPEEQR